MINMFLKWVVFSLMIMLVAWIVPGISVETFWTAMLVSVVIALINTFIKPMIRLISIPITILSLGAFSLVINAFLFMFAGYVTPGFTVSGFLSALFGSVLLSVFSLFMKNL